MYTGAVLFRGFKIEKGIEFERAMQQYEPELSKDYHGTSPRKQLPGTEVFYFNHINNGNYFLFHCSMSSQHQSCHGSSPFLNTSKCLSLLLPRETFSSVVLMNQSVQVVRQLCVTSRKFTRTLTLM